MNKFLEELASIFDKSDAERSQQLITHSSDAIIAVNHLGLVTTWNPAAEKLFGYFEHEVLGSDLALHIIQPKNQKNYYGKLFSIIERGEIPIKLLDKTFETTALRRDGIIIPIELSVFQAGSNQTREYAAIVRDIYDRKTQEHHLKHYAEILEMAVVGISFLDNEGYYTQVNKAYAKTLGYSRIELLGMHWSKTVPEKDLSSAKNAYTQMLETGKGACEILGLRKNGQTFYKQIMMVRHDNEHGNFSGHYCFMKDISHLTPQSLHTEQGLEKETASLRFQSGIGLL